MKNNTLPKIAASRKPAPAQAQWQRGPHSGSMAFCKACVAACHPLRTLPLALLAALCLSALLLAGCGVKSEGASAYYRGDYDASAAAYETALKQDPDNFMTWRWLGRARMGQAMTATGELAQTRWNEAIRAFEKDLSLKPEDSLGTLYLGLAHIGKSEGRDPARKNGWNLIITRYNPLYRTMQKHVVVDEARRLSTQPDLPFEDILRKMERAVDRGEDRQKNEWDMDGRTTYVPWKY